MRAAFALVSLLLAFGVRADDELSRWLEELAAQPLDLRRAELEEVARLPWIDRLQAEAIIELRDRGALHSAQDLVDLGILDASTWRAIEDFVALAPQRRELRLQAEGTTAWTQRVDSSRRKLRLSARSGAWRAEAREDGRFSVARSATQLQIAFGWSRVARDRDLLLHADAAKSRTAPLAASRGALLRSHRSAERASGSMIWRDRLAMSSDGRRLQLHSAIGGVARCGLRVAPDASPVWLLGFESDSFDLYWLAEGSHAAFVVAGARTSLQGLEAGVDFSRSAHYFVASLDPISGRRLDRPHRAGQAHLRWRGRSHSTLLLLRQIRRGFAWQAPRDEARLSFQSSLRGPHWKLRLRSTLDREGSRSPQLRLAMSCSRSLGWGVSQDLDLSWQPAESGDRRLYAFTLRGGRRWLWQITLRQSDGAGSVYDAPGLGGGARTLWLGPGSQRWAASLDRGPWGLWLDSVRIPGDSGPDLRAGGVLRLRWGPG